jgi:hypothetical protein
VPATSTAARPARRLTLRLLPKLASSPLAMSRYL